MFKYDLNGNMIFGETDVDPTAYGFDGEKRLTEIVKADPKIGTGTGFDCADQDNSGAGNVINVIDLQLIGAAAGNKPGEPDFAIRDVTGDGVINTLDLQREAGRVGSDCPTAAHRYIYAGDGTQLKRALEQGGTTSWTVYIGGVFEKTNTGGGAEVLRRGRQNDRGP